MNGTVCGHCGALFLESDHLALHRGRAHPERLSSDDRAAFEGATDREAAWLRHLAHHMRAALSALPVLVLYAYTLILLYEMDGNIGWALMLMPGFVVFTGLVYAMVFTRQTARGARPDTLMRDLADRQRQKE